jgi:putative glutamine amidotransferase
MLILDEVFFMGEGMSATKKPLIGITSGIITNPQGSLVSQVGQAYIHAIESAGGVPVIVPVLQISDSGLDSLLPRLDGVLFTGGGDIELQRFNGKPHPKVYGVSPERDSLEFGLLEKVIKSGKSLLAICRGIQVLNVAFGGDLYTHIQDQLDLSLKHDWFPDYPRDKIAHTVSIKKDSLLEKIFETNEVEVNSLHHQGVSLVGEGLEATAFSPDGLVEGLEVRGSRFAVGVQWHPECLPSHPAMKKLFGSFIDSCLNS